MNDSQSESIAKLDELIAKYFPVMAKHYAAAYRLAAVPPESVRQAAAERLTLSSSQTPRRAVDAILAALDDWRANAEVPASRAA